MTTLTAIIGRLTSYVALSVHVTLPGFLLAVAVVLSQVDLPPTKPAPLAALLEWSSLNETLAERLEVLNRELQDTDALLRHAQGEVETATEANTRDDTSATLAALASAEANARNQQTLWNSIHEEMKALRTKRGEHMPTLPERLIGNVIALGLLSIAIGTLLRPINGVILRPIERLYEKRSGNASSRTSLDKRVLTKIRTKAVTQEEYDLFVDRHYSPVEAMVGLCIPAFTLCAVLTRWWSEWMWLAGCGVVLVLLYFGYGAYERFAAHLETFADA